MLGLYVVAIVAMVSVVSVVIVALVLGGRVKIRKNENDIEIDAEGKKFPSDDN